MGLSFKKGVLEIVVQILDKYTYRVSKNRFLKLNFFTGIFKGFDHNYYDNSLKYAAKRNLRILASNNWYIHIPEEILIRNTSVFWVFAVSKEMK